MKPPTKPKNYKKGKIVKKDKKVPPTPDGHSKLIQPKKPENYEPGGPSSDWRERGWSKPTDKSYGVNICSMCGGKRTCLCCSMCYDCLIIHNQDKEDKKEEDKKKPAAGKKKKKKVSLCRFDCARGVLLNVVLYSRYTLNIQLRSILL